MVITALKLQQKDPNRVSVYGDSEYVFSLTLDQVLEEKLKKGQEIDQVQLAYFKKLSTDGKAKLRAQAWLLVRPRSVKEFRDYLKRKQIDIEVSEGFVSFFLKAKLLNDDVFARWWYEQRVRSGKSERYITAELAQKGIKKVVLQSAVTPIPETDRLQALIAKKRRMTRYKDPEKLMQYLVRQGYGYSLVKELLVEE